MDDYGNQQNLEKDYREKKIVLGIVILISAFIFVVEFRAGLRCNSVSLIADSLHRLEEMMIYISGLFVLPVSPKTQAKLCFAKGIVMFLITIFALSKAFYYLLVNITPDTKVMSLVAIFALGANYLSLVLLTKFGGDKINKSPRWFFSQNKIIINILILITAGLVAITNSLIFDTVTGLILTMIFAKSAIFLLFRSLKQLY